MTALAATAQGKLAWLAIAAVTIGLGAAAIVVLAPWTRDFLDARRVLQAGEAWASGHNPYDISGYFYTPALAVVASFLPDWSVGVVVVGGLLTAVALSPRHPIAVFAVLCYPPVWGDLALGNVTILLTGAVALAIARDHPLRGVPLGIGLALVPKPMFVPIVLWLLVHRRRSATGVVLAGLAVTLPALLTGLYPAFVMALVRGIGPSFEGNLGITAWLPWAGIPMTILALVLTLLVIRREEAGLMVAAIAGTLMGTYVGLYAPVLPASLLARFERHDGRRGLVLGTIGSVAWLALPVAAAAGLLVAMRSGRRDADGEPTA